MLLINDGQSQVVELHCIYNEGMGTDKDLQLAVHQRLVDGGAFPLARRACQKSYLHAQPFGQRLNRFQVLSCENLGGCHNACLIAVIQSYQGCHESDYRLATAHIALQQAVHLLATTHIVTNLADDPLLSPRERELQEVMVEIVEVVSHMGKGMPHQSAGTAFDIMQDIEFQEKQLLELETELGALQSLLIRWYMDVAQGLGQRHEAVALHQFRRQGLCDVLHSRCVEHIEQKFMDSP